MNIKKKKINRQIIYRINNSQVKKIYKEEDALHSLFEGEALLFVSSSYALKIDVRNYPLRGIEEPEAEKAISEDCIDLISNAIRALEKIEGIEKKYLETNTSLKNIYYRTLKSIN